MTHPFDNTEKATEQVRELTERVAGSGRAFGQLALKREHLRDLSADDFNDRLRGEAVAQTPMPNLARLPGQMMPLTASHRRHIATLRHY